MRQPVFGSFNSNFLSDFQTFLDYFTSSHPLFERFGIDTSSFIYCCCKFRFELLIIYIWKNCGYCMACFTTPPVLCTSRILLNCETEDRAPKVLRPCFPVKELRTRSHPSHPPPNEEDSRTAVIREDPSRCTPHPRVATVAVSQVSFPAFFYNVSVQAVNKACSFC